MRSTSPRLLRIIANAAALCALVGVDDARAADTAPASPVISSDEILYDHSQIEWSESYLQWIDAFARGSSAISDASGALCGAKQQGEVWFLATSDGTAPVVRSCAIPAGKTLFVPVVDTVERSGNKEPNCPSMVRVAAGSIPHMSRLSMTIDGEAVYDLESHRIATGDCFALGLRGSPRLTARTATADGYYVMLRPLAPGPHTIVVGARVDEIALSTTYRLDVR